MRALARHYPVEDVVVGLGLRMLPFNPARAERAPGYGRRHHRLCLVFCKFHRLCVPPPTVWRASPGFLELVAMRLLLAGVFLLGFFKREFLAIVRPDLLTFSGELPPDRLLCGDLGSVTGFHGFPVFLEFL